MPAEPGRSVVCFACARCGYTSAIAKAACPRCGGPGPGPLEPVGRGELVDFVPVHHPPENLKHLGPYVSVLVRLVNGCQTFGIFLGDPAGLRVGGAMVADGYREAAGPFFRREDEA